VKPSAEHSVLSIVAVALLGGVVAVVISNLEVSFVFGAAALVGLLLVFLARPTWGLSVILLLRASSDLSLRFLAAGAFGGRVGSLPNFALIMVLTLAGGLYILARGVPMINLPGGRLLILLLLTGLLGVVRSPSTLVAMNEWIPVLASLATYALAASLFHNPQSVQRVAIVILASAILPVMLGLLQLLGGVGVTRPDFETPGVVGTFLHPNTFGFYLVMVAAILLGHVVYYAGKRRAVALAALGVVLVLIVTTYARVAWAGALVVLLVVGILEARVILLLLPIATLAVVTAVPTVAARMADALAGGGSLGDRLYNLWPATIRGWFVSTAAEGGGVLLAVNRLAGLGPGAGTSALGAHGLSAIPHNDYLRILVEYGVFGLILYFALSGVLAVFAFRTWRETRSADPHAAAIALAFLTVTLAFPIMSITDNIFAHTVNQVYFWTMAGLAVALSRWVRSAEDVAPSGTVARELRAWGGFVPEQPHST
jgi:hypothetical protein